MGTSAADGDRGDDGDRDGEQDVAGEELGSADAPGVGPGERRIVVAEGGRVDHVGEGNVAMSQLLVPVRPRPEGGEIDADPGAAHAWCLTAPVGWIRWMTEVSASDPVVVKHQFDGIGAARTPRSHATHRASADRDRSVLHTRGMARRVPEGPPPPPTVQRLRVRYAKRGRLRFTSHRDFARAFERALRRAEIPMAYSAGFSPHPKISYVGAAPTGVASEAEYLEIGLAREMDPAAVRADLDRVLPDGLDIDEVVVAGPGSLPERMQASIWRIELPGIDEDTARAALDAFLARDEIGVERVLRPVAASWTCVRRWCAPRCPARPRTRSGSSVRQ